EYTYWKTYQPGARPIASRMALKFTTNYSYRTGVAMGEVKDAATNQPIPYAEVATSTGYWSRSDERGRYLISDVKAGERWTLTAYAQGWNDSTQGPFQVAVGETVEVNFYLTHPTFELTPLQLTVRLREGDTESSQLDIANRGNGTLLWRAQRRVNEESAPWGLVYSLPVTDITNDTRIEGVVFAEGNFYVCGAAGNEPNAVYIITPEGELVGRFNQHGESIYGYRDLAYDGRLIWGSGERRIYGFSLEGELIRSLDGPIARTTALTWDPDRQLLWVADITTNIYAIDLNGNVIQTISRRNLRIYGLGYFPQDPRGKTLYILCRDPDTDAKLIYCINPEGGEPELLTELDPQLGGSPGGVFITAERDGRNWDFQTIVKNVNPQGHDVLRVYHLAPRADWFSLALEEGILPPDSSFSIELNVDASQIPRGEYEGEIVFWHNAQGGRTILPIHLEVRARAGGLDIKWLSLVQGWNAVSLNIQPPDLNLSSLMAPLREAGVLRLVKDGRGRFYDPERDFDNIGEWRLEEGYQLYLTSPFRWRVEGQALPEDQPIPLRAGWNIVPYYPLLPMTPQGAFRDLDDNLLMAKDQWGRFYLPRWDFSNMEMLEEGNAYWVKVSQPDTLVYRPGDNALLASDLYPNMLNGKYEHLNNLSPQPKKTSPKHYPSLVAGETSMSVLLLGEPIWEGWEVKAVNPEGEIVGSGQFDLTGRCGLAIWGSLEKGWGENENREPRKWKISWWIWDGSQEHPFDVEVLEGEELWHPDGVMVGKIIPNFTITTPKDIILYPNPFNSRLTLKFHQGSPGPYKIILTDLGGRTILTIAQGSTDRPTTHTQTISTAHLPSGVYLVRISTRENTLTRKVLLLR
ncbi:MAG: T9SS type A sorting domain-containing protein, partial [bacterium]